MPLTTYPGYEIENFEDKGSTCYIPESSWDTQGEQMKEPDCGAVNIRRISRCSWWKKATFFLRHLKWSC